MSMTTQTLPEGFTIERHEARRAYVKNGNVGNPTIEYRYTLHLDGRQVDSDSKRKSLVTAANEYGRKGYSA
jgi:hypothetical protein